MRRSLARLLAALALVLALAACTGEPPLPARSAVPTAVSASQPPSAEGAAAAGARERPASEAQASGDLGTGQPATGNTATGNTATGNSAAGNTATGHTTAGNTVTENTAADNAATDESASRGETGEANPDAAQREEASETSEATLMAVGDIMVHAPQLPGYYNASTKTYDFTPWFREVKPLFSAGDWVVGNLETPLAGGDLKYSGYPRFNAPAELATALADAGFDIVTTANNHTLDRGFVGLTRTLGNVRDAGLIPVGTAASAWQAKQTVIVERRGIRLGFLAYTYGTNGIAVPKDKPYAVNLISLPAIAADIKRLREEGADAVSVSLHFGTEYERQPNAEQRSIARAVIESGADIVLGSHPHVVQPYETIEVPDPTRAGGTRRGLIVYSMGNFISNQTGDWKDVGVIMQIRLRKSAAGGKTVTTVDKVSATPTWVLIRKQNRFKTYTIVPLPQTLAARDSKRWTAAEYAEMEKLLKGINRHLTSLSPP